MRLLAVICGATALDCHAATRLAMTVFGRFGVGFLGGICGAEALDCHAATRLAMTVFRGLRHE